MSIKPFPADKDCYDFMRDGGQPTPDADISGFGVILAFTLSAYLTFSLVLSAYLFGQVDGSLLNVVDTQVFRMRPRPPRHPGSKPPRFHTSVALRQAILSLSDQQIVTGIAIMAAGFQGLRLGGIDSYHYQIVVYLAWMSSSVHLSALSILAPILKARPALRVWRLTGMLVLLVLLIIGLVPTVSNDWGLIWWEGMTSQQIGWGVPAICFWGETWGDGVNPDAVLGFLILVISYCWKVGGLFEGVCFAYHRWMRYPVEWAFECLLAYTARRYSSAHRRGKTTRLAWLAAHRMVIAIWVPYFAVFETLASFSTAIWISCLGLIFGTIQIAVPRRQNQALLGGNEDTWGFGQLVPLILLIQPFSVVWEHIMVDPKANKDEDFEQQSSQDTVQDPTARKPSFQDHVPQEVHRSTTLLHLLSAYEPIKPAERMRLHPTPVEHVLLRSRVFHANVFLTQPAIISAAAVAFQTDANWIGYSTTGNWIVFCYVLVAYVGIAWCLTFCLVPWVRMGKRPDGSGTFYTANSGSTEIDLREGLPRTKIQPP